MAARGVYGTVLIGRNQLHIFDNDNFSIIPKYIVSDNDNLPISCKNANISAVDNFFDNIAHPYITEMAASVLKEGGKQCCTPREKEINKDEWKLQKCYNLNKSLR